MGIHNLSKQRNEKEKGKNSAPISFVSIYLSR